MKPKPRRITNAAWKAVPDEMRMEMTFMHNFVLAGIKMANDHANAAMKSDGEAVSIKGALAVVNHSALVVGDIDILHKDGVLSWKMVTVNGTLHEGGAPVGKVFITEYSWVVAGILMCSGILQSKPRTEVAEDATVP